MPDVPTLPPVRGAACPAATIDASGRRISAGRARHALRGVLLATAAGQAADIVLAMLHHELAEFDANPSWSLLLAAYARATASRAEWSRRLTDVPGLPGEQLSTIHGRLIALGFLRFEIANGADGVQYQLTPLGQQALLPAEERTVVPEWMQAAEAEAAAA